MELLNVSTLSSNPLSLPLILLLSLVIWLMAKRRNLNLPPSPPKLPITGNIHQLGKLPHRSLRDLSDKYGSLLLLQLGYNPTLLVSSVHMATEIVKNHDIVFSNRPRTTAVDHLFYESKGMGFTPYGEYWRQVRKLSVVELLSNQRVHSFQFVRHEEVEALINKIRGASLKGEPIYKKDFVSIIIQLQKDGMFENLTQDNIKAILLDMFLGGTDTSMSTSEWMLAELLKHPNAMKRVQQEVRNVVGNKSFVAPEDVSRMEYFKCVVKETLRLHPPFVFLHRKTSSCVKLGGYDIPSNTPVLINVWAIHMDPERWEKPDEFIPERFENSSIDFQSQDFHFIPFGLGRRVCPGMSFGIASVEYVMANLLYWFDWKLPTGETAETVDMTETYGLAVSKKTPLHALPCPQSSF